MARPKKDAEQSDEPVRMVRDEPQIDGGPIEALVHPDEVENMKDADWREA